MRTNFLIQKKKTTQLRITFKLKHKLDGSRYRGRGDCDDDVKKEKKKRMVRVDRSCQVHAC